MSVCFVDCETTGLDPDRHEIWELAIIVAGVGDEPDKEYVWHLPVDLAKADPNGLRIGRFYERRRAVGGWTAHLAPLHRVLYPGSTKWEAAGLPVTDTAETVAGLLDGTHIVGAVPSFDAAFLGPWLRAHGQAATWHYHLIDVEALAAGWIAAQPKTIYDAALRVVRGAEHKSPLPPWDSTELSRAVGVDPDQFDRHTALGDARWAKAIYEAVMGA